MRNIVVAIISSNTFSRSGIREMLLAQDASGIMDIVECDPSDGGKEIYTLIAQSDPDVFLIDMGHPPLNELELARTITRYSPSIRVVIISSNPYDSDDELLEVIKSGAAGYLRSKNCSPATVVDTIVRVAKGEYPINDIVSNIRIYIPHESVNRLQVFFVFF